VTICIGCTGGRHRSVHLVERLTEHFRQNYQQVLSYHRELE
jgi:RNase adapter protein RapZ